MNRVTEEKNNLHILRNRWWCEAMRLQQCGVWKFAWVPEPIAYDLPDGGTATDSMFGDRIERVHRSSCVGPARGLSSTAVAAVEGQRNDVCDPDRRLSLGRRAYCRSLRRWSERRHR